VGIRHIGVLVVCGGVALAFGAAADAQLPQQDLASFVNPFVGTANGGNTYPGATLPFGMVAFSPEEESEKDPLRVPAPGGYEWRATRIRGFSLTHLSGPGCPASGDVPLMPVTQDVAGSPSAAGSSYSTAFSHENERSSPGFYAVKLDNGVEVELSATQRTGIARFSFPVGHPEHILFRVSDSENGSSNAQIKIDPGSGIVSGSVTSGGFCGPRSGYYTLHFVAVIDQPFHAGGTWAGSNVHPGATKAEGGTFSANLNPPAMKVAPEQAKGSGGWLDFDPRQAPVITVRIGISYVSQAAARANLEAEEPHEADQRHGPSFDEIRMAARLAWNRSLGEIAIKGGTPGERTVFYTALYHALLAPNLTSDVDNHYRGFDGKIHELSAGQQAQYANFSLWDVYRSQLQLVTWLHPQIGSDVAQSMLNQAEQNGGVWDRWTHLTGATGVMNGDPSAPAIADIIAFGGEHFDLAAAYASLLKAATMPTADDDHLSPKGQRPDLAEELKVHYIPAGASDGSAADTLEMATADFALSELARRAGDEANAQAFRERSGWWRNLFNAHATKNEGYIQPRNADGSWPAFDPSLWGAGFVEGSGAQYLWMVPYDPKGLFDAMGGNTAAQPRLDRFFHNADGSWAWSNQASSSAGLHANLSNEPTIETPWLYDFAGQPWKTQETVRAAMAQLWSATPRGLPGNDDLGEMSSWYVWAAMGFYPIYPGRAELMLGSPSFSQIVVNRPGGAVTIRAPNAAADAPYVSGLKVGGQQTSHPWLPASFAEKGGTLDFNLVKTPDQSWGSAPKDTPPSFGPSP
jgi:predicted alpha-1,2-mannosidase